MLDSGVVDQNVDPAERFVSFLDHFGDFGWLRHVRRGVGSPDVIRHGQLGADFLNFFHIAETVEHDVHAGCGERLGDPKPDAASGTGDDGGFARKRAANGRHGIAGGVGCLHDTLLYAVADQFSSSRPGPAQLAPARTTRPSGLSLSLWFGRLAHETNLTFHLMRNCNAAALLIRPHNRKAGSRNSKAAPRCGPWAVTSTRPPWRSAISRTIHSPSPQEAVLPL